MAFNVPAYLTKNELFLIVLKKYWSNVPAICTPSCWIQIYLNMSKNCLVGFSSHKEDHLVQIHKSYRKSSYILSVQKPTKILQKSVPTNIKNNQKATHTQSIKSQICEGRGSAKGTFGAAPLFWLAPRVLFIFLYNKEKKYKTIPINGIISFLFYFLLSLQLS